MYEFDQELTYVEAGEHHVVISANIITGVGKTETECTW